MELRDYIEAGIKKRETAVSLAEELEQDATALRNAKAHRRGLPVYACIKLANLIGADPLEIIAASELVTEKREDRKAIFRPFVQMGRLAHPMSVTIATIATALAAIFETTRSIFPPFDG